MSDPVSNSDIEDVLSSIRRLVSEEPVARKPVDKDAEAHADRLVLTPAFRIPDEGDSVDEGAGNTGVSSASESETENERAEADSDVPPADDTDSPEAFGSPEVDKTQDVLPVETPDADDLESDPQFLDQSAEMASDVAPDEEAGNPIVLHPALNNQAETEADDRNLIPDGSSLSAEAASAAAAALAAFEATNEWSDESAAGDDSETVEDQSPETNPVDMSLQQRIAELEAAIEQSPHEWEPDGSEDGTDDETRPLSDDLVGAASAIETISKDLDDALFESAAATDESDLVGDESNAGLGNTEESEQNTQDTMIVDASANLDADSDVASSENDAVPSQEEFSPTSLNDELSDPVSAESEEAVTIGNDEEPFHDPDGDAGTDTADELASSQGSLPDETVEQDDDKELATNKSSGRETGAAESLHDDADAGPDTEMTEDYKGVGADGHTDPKSEESVHAEPVTQETAAEIWEDIEADKDDDADTTVPEEISAVDASDETSSDDELDEDNVLFDDPATIDEEALRVMIGELIRQELQGVLGERITRNVRRLVRREIQRALAVRDLE